MHAPPPSAAGTPGLRSRSPSRSGRPSPGSVRVCVLAAAVASLAAAPLAAQNAAWTLAAYVGASKPMDGSVHLTRADADLRFDPVSWASEDLAGPIYYGVRFGRRWASGWSVEVDFTHAKMIARLQRSAHVSGTRGGLAVDADERLDTTFDDLRFSHGYNLLLLVARHRWRVPQTGSGRRLQPYAGAGAGVVLPHVEVAVGGSVTGRYQLGGPALQGLAGVALDLSRAWAIFGEYKLSWASIDGELVDGGAIRTRPVTHHLLLGGSYAIGP